MASETTTLKFGTSGLRGLARELDGLPAYQWSRAFVQLLLARGEIAAGAPVFVARDLRASSASIAHKVFGAISDAGLIPVDCGEVSTPALALHAMANGAASIMVTGSHIPEDRNGLKFYRPSGEIDKADEAGIVAAHAQLASPKNGIDAQAALHAFDAARLGYLERQVSAFGPQALRGMRIGIYEHSTVARDQLCDIMEALGATILRHGRAERFVPVDTEALAGEHRQEVLRLANKGKLDAIISADGDGDRPLLADGRGNVIAGDLAGALTARFLGAQTLAVPVTCNSALEAFLAPAQVIRTRIGSPHVIAAMAEAEAGGQSAIAGFEANGGFLLGSNFEGTRGILPALPTRDAGLAIIAPLILAAQLDMTLQELAAGAGFRAAQAGLVRRAQAQSFAGLLADLRDAPEKLIGNIPGFGTAVNTDRTDGVRITAASGDVVHLRMSGNAPEMRCYVEADSQEQAAALLQAGLALVEERAG